MVHGGPWVRGTDLSWNADAQFLASRGYRVLEPEFRGSQGYGLDHFRAGWKQWGRAMQDDLADAVQWAVAQKLVDPSRVCVYGNGYGGYASLMAPISHPATFRCAASVGAAVDIDLMYSIAWRGSGFSENHKSHGMPVLIGDREKDAAMLAAASPLKRVGEIKVPVLLAHGAADRRVPLDHAKQFVSAAREAGVAVEPVYYTNEALGWFDPANHADFLSRLERFLAKSLQPVR
jgi:dipeptidyl aminopeptidase/acylaminoacyl peptidase